MSLESVLSTRHNESSTNLGMLFRQVETFRTIDPEIQAQAMSTLLVVAIADPEPITMRDIGIRTGTAQSSVSRNVAMLGKIHRKGQSGHGLVDSYEDPMNRRVKLVKLTPKGTRFIHTL